MTKSEKHYTIYLKSTGELIAKGNLEEVASQLRIKLTSFKTIVSNAKAGKGNKYRIIAENPVKEKANDIEKTVVCKSQNYKKWQLCQQIINTVRQAKGLPLRDNENPYGLRESRKVER